MQLTLATDEEHQRQPGPQLVAAPAAAPAPEQLVLALLEIVRDRVDAVQAGQRLVVAELRDIRANLPMQRRPISKRTEEIHIRATWARRNGLCPCCQETPVVNASGRLEGAEVDHWYSRNQNRVTQVWIVCRTCNGNLNNTDFKAAARSAFEAYQLAVRPFLGARQIALSLTTSGESAV